MWVSGNWYRNRVCDELSATNRKQVDFSLAKPVWKQMGVHTIHAQHNTCTIQYMHNAILMFWACSWTMTGSSVH